VSEGTREVAGYDARVIVSWNELLAGDRSPVLSAPANQPRIPSTVKAGCHQHPLTSNDEVDQVREAPQNGAPHATMNNRVDQWRPFKASLKLLERF
jgi:hypothetical protein